jgi:hypothetical protein
MDDPNSVKDSFEDRLLRAKNSRIVSESHPLKQKPKLGFADKILLGVASFWLLIIGGGLFAFGMFALYIIVSSLFG